MTELTQICRAARESNADPLWLATVMRVKGSAYRHSGARMLFSNERVLAGSISGGCLEAGIVRKGPWLARERPICIRLDGRPEEDEVSPRGSGCEGVCEVLIERASFNVPCAPLAVIEECLRAERRAVLATVFESRDPLAPVGARLGLDDTGNFDTSALSGPAWAALARAARQAQAERPGPRLVSADRFEALLEIIEPPPHLFVFGAGPDTLPLVEFATLLGFGVTVCDNSGRAAVRERFAARKELQMCNLASVAGLIARRRTPVAVIMSHHYPTDQQALALLLESDARYIGLLGPERRSERMLGELLAARPTLAERDLTRMHAPIGLDLGGETPAHIALSVISEVQAVLARASAQPLSERGRRPIHRPVPEATLSAAPEWGKTGTE